MSLNFLRNSLVSKNRFIPMDSVGRPKFETLQKLSVALGFKFPSAAQRVQISSPIFKKQGTNVSCFLSFLFGLPL